MADELTAARGAPKGRRRGDIPEAAKFSTHLTAVAEAAKTAAHTSEHQPIYLLFNDADAGEKTRRFIMCVDFYDTNPLQWILDSPAGVTPEARTVELPTAWDNLLPLASLKDTTGGYSRVVVLARRPEVSRGKYRWLCMSEKEGFFSLTQDDMKDSKKLSSFVSTLSRRFRSPDTIARTADRKAVLLGCSKLANTQLTVAGADLHPALSRVLPAVAPAIAATTSSGAHGKASAAAAKHPPKPKPASTNASNSNVLTAAPSHPPKPASTDSSAASAPTISTTDTGGAQPEPAPPYSPPTTMTDVLADVTNAVGLAAKLGHSPMAPRVSPTALLRKVGTAGYLEAPILALPVLMPFLVHPTLQIAAVEHPVVPDERTLLARSFDLDGAYVYKVAGAPARQRGVRPTSSISTQRQRSAALRFPVSASGSIVRIHCGGKRHKGFRTRDNLEASNTIHILLQGTTPECGARLTLTCMLGDAGAPRLDDSDNDDDNNDDDDAFELKDDEDKVTSTQRQMAAAVRLALSNVMRKGDNMDPNCAPAHRMILCDDARRVFPDMNSTVPLIDNVSVALQEELMSGVTGVVSVAWWLQEYGHRKNEDCISQRGAHVNEAATHILPACNRVLQAMHSALKSLTPVHGKPSRSELSLGMIVTLFRCVDGPPTEVGSWKQDSVLFHERVMQTVPHQTFDAAAVPCGGNFVSTNLGAGVALGTAGCKVTDMRGYDTTLKFVGNLPTGAFEQKAYADGDLVKLFQILAARQAILDASYAVARLEITIDVTDALEDDGTLLVHHIVAALQQLDVLALMPGSLVRFDEPVYSRTHVAWLAWLGLWAAAQAKHMKHKKAVERMCKSVLQHLHVGNLSKHVKDKTHQPMMQAWYRISKMFGRTFLLLPREYALDGLWDLHAPLPKEIATPSWIVLPVDPLRGMQFITRRHIVFVTSGG
jgi:hypothetical protein